MAIREYANAGQTGIESALCWQMISVDLAVRFTGRRAAATAAAAAASAVAGRRLAYYLPDEQPLLAVNHALAKCNTRKR